MYEVHILPRVYKTWKRLPKPFLRRLIERIQALASDPRPPGSKKLRGHKDVYRLRVGDYRILYRIDDERRRVIILNIGHRKDVYRYLK